MSIRAHTDGRRLDQRVTFERNYPTQDGNGDPVADWRTLVKDVNASVDGALAQPAEPYISRGILSRSDYTVWIRADVKERFGITVLDRVSWKGNVFNIKDMPDQQLRGRMIAVICNAGINEG